MIDLDAALHANKTIVPLIYEAVAGVRVWDDVLPELIGFIGCDRGAITISYLASGQGEVVAAHGFESEALREWETGFADNEWVQLAARVPAGLVLHDARDKPVDDIRETAIGRELISPQGVKDGVGVKLTDSPLFVGAFSSYSTKEMLGQRSVDHLDFLVPHLARGLSLHQRFTTLHSQSLAFERSIDDMAAGVLFLRPSGEVMHMNTMAMNLAASADGFSVHGNKIEFEHRPTRDDFEAAVKNASKPDPRHARRGLFLISRASDLRPYHAMVTPAVSEGAGDSTGTLMLWVTDPEDPPVPSEEGIATLLGLTPAEARLGRGLASGASLLEYARSVGITENTARSTVKQVFAKTATRSQADLVRLILQSIPNPPL